MSDTKTLTQFKNNGVWRDESGHMWVPIEAVTEAVQAVLTDQMAEAPEQDSMLSRGVRYVAGDEFHKLGRVHGGMRYCMDKGCNYGRFAQPEER